MLSIVLLVHSLDNILPGSAEVADFSISVSEDTPIGHNVAFYVDVSGTDFSTTLSSSFTVGITYEDFESSSFVGLPWNFSNSGL